MSIKITRTDKNGKEVVTTFENNVLKGYTINDKGIYKTKDGSFIQVETEAIEIEAKEVKNGFIEFFKWLINYVNKKDKVKR